MRENFYSGERVMKFLKNKEKKRSRPLMNASCELFPSRMIYEKTFADTETCHCCTTYLDGHMVYVFWRIGMDTDQFF